MEKSRKKSEETIIHWDKVSRKLIQLCYIKGTQYFKSIMD